MSFYTSLSGGPASRSRTVAASQRAVTQAAKQEAASELQEALDEILNLHRRRFLISRAPQAPAPPPVDRTRVVAEHEARELAGIGRFRRAERRQARARAAASADQHIAHVETERRREQQFLQNEMDRWWSALQRNESDIVLSVLAEAFDDNEAPAAAVGVDGSEVALVVLVPTIAVIPERKPGLTPAGNLTLKKLTKAERGSFHTTAVASHVLLTVKEALAVAPALTACRIVAVQHAGNDAYGRPRMDVLLAARFERARLRHVAWDHASAPQVVDDTSTELVTNLRKVTNQLQPIDLTREPAIAALLDRVEFGDLVSRS